MCSLSQSTNQQGTASKSLHDHIYTQTSLYLQRVLKLPVLLQILLDHFLDGIGTWAERVSSLSTETFLDKVVKSVFLPVSSGSISGDVAGLTVPCTPALTMMKSDRATEGSAKRYTEGRQTYSCLVAP
jgi:hypothetical protein